ncbi:MAG TPA: rhodanese-like domain-containing protein [Pilimelia sp.]|nr:rhodanese-like domain-containing protein [Pilimelia sp.]
MLLRQHYLECLSQASYLVADETTGRAVVVDPRRDVDELLAECAARGLRVEGVVNTHFHADFVAGHLEVAAATGAWIGYGRRAVTEYPIRRLADGDTIVLGEVTLTIIETPGHTPESVCLVVRERADAPPHAVLTGDTLFVGDVGRPDLLASAGTSAEELGAMLYASVQRLLALPDDVLVYPAHGAGSSCGKNLSTARHSTIGEQRRTNYACQPMSEQEFVALVTDGQKSAPGYFAFAAALNKQARPLFAQAADVPTLGWAAVRAALAEGVVTLDARDADSFAGGHLPGAVNVPLDGRFAETAGTVLRPDEPVLVVAPQGREAEVVTRLARVGFDAIRGVAAAPLPADALTRTSRIDAAELRERLAAPDAPLLLDVRNCGERENGALIEAARHIPLAELPQRLAEVPTDRPIVVHCAGGYRSSVAASLLRRAGVGAPVTDLRGGFAAWSAASPVT